MAENKNDILKRFLTIFFVSILTRFVLVYISYLMLGSSSLSYFIYDVFSIAGDSPRYIDIATNWYVALGENAKNIVFYPLYPILLRLFSYIFRDYVLTGIVISNVMFGVACAMIYELALVEFNKNNAFYVPLFLITFPFGIFFFGLFTESLFVLLTVLTMYFARKHKWWLAGICGCLTSFTRVQGILVAVFVVFEYIHMIFNGETSFADGIKKIRLNILSVLIIPVGFVAYMCINKVVQGSFTAFQAHLAAPPWWQTLKWIGDNLIQHYDMAVQYHYLAFIIYYVQIALFIFCGGLLVYAVITKMRSSYIAYTFCYMFVTYSSGWMISGGRYVMGCVPVYFLLAGIKNKTVKFVLLSLFTMLLVFYSILFMQKQAIM